MWVKERDTYCKLMYVRGVYIYDGEFSTTKDKKT